MSEIVRFKAPSGDEMVMLSAFDFERLVVAAEDAADGAAYDRVKRDLASGDDELIPSEVVDRILSGENRIKVWREYRHMTTTTLATKADIGQGFLSQIESGKRQGTIGTLTRIAAALRVSLDDLAGTEPTNDAKVAVLEA